MSLSKLPTEVWTIIFESLDIPKSTCVIRKGHNAAVRNATLEYEAGRSYGVTNLPEFERSKWRQMQQYYNIDSSTREAAVRVKLSERWFNSFEHVLKILRRPNSTAVRRCKKSSFPAYYDVSTGQQPSFHGSSIPNYIALNLYNLSHRDNARAELMNSAKNDFIDFAVDNPVFSSLRRLDLIVRVFRKGQNVARRHLDVLVRCVNAQWDKLGVHNGVVRMFWEIMPEVAELDRNMLTEIMEEQSDDDDTIDMMEEQPEDDDSA